MIIRSSSYIYGMDKYSGCNIVESVVSNIEHPRKEKKRNSHKAFFIRLILAIAAVGVILFLHYVPIAAFEGVKAVLHDVFCYDLFGRTSFGTSVFFG